MRRIVLSLSTLIAGLLWATAPASAQGTASVTPAKAGKPSTLHYEVDGQAAPLNGRLPSALALTTPAGFRMDLDALAKRCSEQAAKLNECPRGSLMGTGSLEVIVTAPDGVREVDIALSVYLHSRKRILAVAYVFGWQVVPATLDRGDGIVVDFDPLPAGPPFPGVSYALKRITLDFGADRIVRKRKVRRVGGKRRVRIVRRRAHLITNPRKCEGSWELSITLRFPDGSVMPLATPTTCTPA